MRTGRIRTTHTVRSGMRQGSKWVHIAYDVLLTDSIWLLQSGSYAFGGHSTRVLSIRTKFCNMELQKNFSRPY